ncbi:putative signal transducing protein [Flavobacterium alkalisoli]|uniref:putative signal transducing protein n=1 Tax=Flavobacterium alkalisoli TaxID=2602769 RepID=UPI003A8D3051
MALVKIYSGSEIEATPIKLTLEEAGINPVVKDNIQSATVAGFGSFGQAMELYVEEHEVEAAAKIAGFNK